MWAQIKAHEGVYAKVKSYETCDNPLIVKAATGVLWNLGEKPAPTSVHTPPPAPATSTAHCHDVVSWGVMGQASQEGSSFTVVRRECVIEAHHGVVLLGQSGRLADHPPCVV